MESNETTFTVLQSPKEYDPYKLPGDLSQALIHQKASRFKPPLPYSESCPCCHAKIEKKELSLNCHVDNLQFGGPGVPLFFRYLQSCMIVMVIIFLTSGIYSMHLIISSNNCQSIEYLKEIYPDLKAASGRALVDLLQNKYKRICVATNVTKYSYANLDQDAIYTLEWLKLLVIIFLSAFLQYNRFLNRKYYFKYDEDNMTPDDFTIVVRNIPQHCSDDITNEIALLFDSTLRKIYTQHKKNFPDDPYYENIDLKPQDTVVNHIELMFHTQEYERVTQDLNLTIAILQKLLQDPKAYAKNKELVRKKIDKLKNQLNELKLRNSEGNEDNFCGAVFLIFEKIAFRELFLEYYKTADIDFYLISLFNKAKKPHLTMYNNPLIIQAADHPDDILWMNQKYTFVEQKKRQLFMTILQILILMSSYLLVSFLSKIKEQYQNLEDVGYYFLIFVAGVISMFNLIIEQIMTKIAQYEKYHTHDELNASITKNSVILQFINCAFVSFSTKTMSNDVVTYQSGLIQQQSVIFFSITFVPVLVNWLDIPQLIKNRLQKQELRQNDNGKRTKTQQELNQLFQHGNFRITDEYSMTQKTMLFTAMYTIVIPWGSLVVFIGLVIYYWILKKKLIFYSCLERKVDYGLNQQIFNQLDYMIPVMILGTSMLEWQIFQGQFEMSYFRTFNIIIGIIIILTPADALNEKLFPLPLPDEHGTYSEQEDKMEGSYQGNNPMVFYKKDLKKIQHSLKNNKKVFKSLKENAKQNFTQREII